MLKTIRFKTIFVSPNLIILKTIFPVDWISHFCHIQFIGKFVSLIRYRVFAVFNRYDVSMCAHVDVCG